MPYDEDKRKPIMLECTHTFCSQCLMTMFKQDKIKNSEKKIRLKCPVCNAVTHKMVKDLKINREVFECDSRMQKNINYMLKE